MSMIKGCTLLCLILFSSQLFSQESESFDLSENGGIKQESTFKTFVDCFKTKKLHLKKTANSYLIQIPYDGKHKISITDTYGKVLVSITTTNKEDWYDIDKSLSAGTYVIKLKTPEMKLFKFFIVI